jgi:hypothetical protein
MVNVTKSKGPRVCDSFIRDLKATGSDGTFSGMVGVYGNLDLNGEVVDQNCFGEDLNIRGPKRKMLWQHDTMSPIGTMLVNEIPLGLQFSAQTCLDTQLGKDSFALVKAGIVDQMSIGFDPIIVNFAPAPGKNDGTVPHIAKGRLWEGSEVTFAANELALINQINAYRFTPRDVLAAHKLRIKEGRTHSADTLEKLKNAIALIDELLADDAETSSAKAFMGLSEGEWTELNDFAKAMRGEAQ